MSTMRKALKVLSLLALVGGVDLVITLIVLNTSGDQAPDLLHSIVMGLVVLFAFLLGAQGISAANVPVRPRPAACGARRAACQCRRCGACYPERHRCCVGCDQRIDHRGHFLLRQRCRKRIPALAVKCQDVVYIRG